MIRRSEFLTGKTLKAMQDHALAAYPHEAAGVVLTGGFYEPLPNMAEDPARFATVSSDRLNNLLASGDLLCVFHSHPNGPHCPSHADMTLQMQTGVAFALISTNGEACTPVSFWGDMFEPEPLFERTFQHGITDCYAAIRDWTRLEKGKLLPDFARGWAWWENDQDLYMRGFPEAGFRPMTDDEVGNPVPGDVILFTVKASTYNHGGVYIGDGLMYHHATGRKPWDPLRLAKRDPLSRWAGFQPLWLRRDEDNQALRGAGQQVRQHPST